jgi:ABC-type multidrug transport system ATPase subunit
MTLDGHMNTELLSSFKQAKSLRQSFLFHLDNINVKFGNKHVLQNINLTINAGEVLFVTGKSGAGKTTLLNILAGELAPTTGKIYRPDAKSTFVAQVFQDLRLYDNKTCEENLWVSYDPSLYKSKNEFHHDLMELVNILGFKDKLNLKISEANGGLKQKVAMVRALLTRPQVLIADEPTAALDNESAIKMFEVLNYYNVKRGLAILWASHNRELVKQFPGKIIHLDSGKLIYSGHACFI